MHYSSQYVHHYLYLEYERETIVQYFSPISLNSFPTMASHQGVITLALTVVLLALPSMTDGVTLHVRPTSTNTSCPTQSCHTHSEYAQYPGRYFNDSNLTLRLLPGDHTVNANLTITSIHQLELLGNSRAEVPLGLYAAPVLDLPSGTSPE